VLRLEAEEAAGHFYAVRSDEEHGDRRAQDSGEGAEVQDVLGVSFGGGVVGHVVEVVVGVVAALVIDDGRLALDVGDQRSLGVRVSLGSIRSMVRYQPSPLRLAT